MQDRLNTSQNLTSIKRPNAASPSNIVLNPAGCWRDSLTRPVHTTKQKPKHKIASVWISIIKPNLEPTSPKNTPVKKKKRKTLWLRNWSNNGLISCVTPPPAWFPVPQAETRSSQEVDRVVLVAPGHPVPLWPLQGALMCTFIMAASSITARGNKEGNLGFREVRGDERKRRDYLRCQTCLSTSKEQKIGASGPGCKRTLKGVLRTEQSIKEEQSGEDLTRSTPSF